jgi:tetratricopeptide (TPR) repeat protein
LKKLAIVGTASAALLIAAGVASARNPHCAGGIQYVVQALKDKERGNTEDYIREINKAVQQLTMCAEQDPADLEAMGYLGWAYAEVESAGPAGTWFQKSIDGLTAKGDKKKVEIVMNNRESYWARAYNEGIKRIGDAQSAYPDYTKVPSEDEKPLKEEAGKQFEAAITSLTRARLLKPGSAVTIRNLGTAYALMGRFDEAEVVLRNGVTEAAQDSAVGGLKDALKTVRANKAGALLDGKKYDEAIAYYQELAQAEPDNSDHLMGMGSALFNRAQTKQDAARRADFKLAGEAYAKAFALKPTNSDLGFNAALAYQSAGELALAEGQWRAVLKQTPEDADALSSLGSTLADMQKFDEAVEVLHRAVTLKPDNKIYFRQLGAVYSKAGNNPKSTEMLMVFMAMNVGKESADPAAVAKGVKAGTAAANTQASMGAPDKVLDWESDGRKLQTWVYAGKKQGFTFDAAADMKLVQKSDWSAAATGGKKPTMANTGDKK